MCKRQAAAAKRLFRKALTEHVSASGNGRRIIGRRRDLPSRVEPVLLKGLSA